MFFVLLMMLGFQDGLVPVDSALVSNGDWRLGGWVDLMSQDAGDQGSYADVPHAYVFIDSGDSRRWRGFAELAYLNGPAPLGQDADSELSLERAYVEYRFDAALKLRLGKVNTSAGLWKENLWSVLVDTTRKPLIEDKRFLPRQIVGAELLGRRTFAQHEWVYAAFISYGNEDADRGGLADVQSGVGFDTSVIFYNRWRVGLFAYDYRNDLEGVDQSPGDRQAWLAYIDLSLLPHRLILRGEYLDLDRENLDPLDGWYLKMKWRITDQLYANLRADQIQVPDGHALVDHHVETLTLGYHVLPQWRVRAEVADHRLKDALRTEYRESSLWMGYIF